MLQEMYGLSPLGVEHGTLDQAYSLSRSGDLESSIGAQAMIQHTGIFVVLF